jgi:CheY-like chemotaxis protein
LVDDNEEILDFLTGDLSDKYKIHTSTNGKQALEILNNETVHLVISDIMMPGIDGYALLKRFKADVRFQSVPVVAYTVHVSEINVAHRHGFDGFLGKPLDSDKFPHQLERILNGEPVWETP